MRIGYFGGSFDPPHRGHLAVARVAAEAFSLDSVLFVPTGHQPLKPTGPIASYADRLAMVTLLCAAARMEKPGKPRFEPSTLEEPWADGVPNYTFETLTRLKATLAPDDVIFVLVGADAFLQIPQWRSPDQLLALAEWIIVSRPGFDLARLDALPLTMLQRRHIHPLPTLADSTSATALRDQLSGHAPRVLLLAGLPGSVLGYIQGHHLYGA